jgi:hypothetical protein
MHENNIGIIYDIFDNEIEFSEIDLNQLDNNEAVELNTILSKYGLWGKYAGCSEEYRIESLITKKYKKRFQNTILDLFEYSEMKSRFEGIINAENDSRAKRLLILLFVNEILELRLTKDDYDILFSDVARILRRDSFKEFLDDYGQNLKIKSAIIAKSLIKSNVIASTKVFDTIIDIIKKLNNLYQGNERFLDAMKSLASCSYLSFIFDYNMDQKMLLTYYENVKELNFTKMNLFFWEQYAIACVNTKEFERAKRYFETAYSLARKRGQNFSTFQIDNHYVRFILERQIYTRKYDGAFDAFIEAHNLLIKKTYINQDERYYQFRVSRLYKDFFNVFYSTFAKIQRNNFYQRCDEMYTELKHYIDDNNRDTMRNDVLECEQNLNYVLLQMSLLMKDGINNENEE